jgi:hypothetical protein
MSFFSKRAESELHRELAHHLHELAAGFERQGYSRAESACLHYRTLTASG